jgi:hypothetical protein
MYEYDGGSYFSGIPLLFMVATYFYWSFCQFTIAKKLGHSSPWWSFVPLLNIYQIVQMANKQWYWFLLFFIPFVSLATWPMAWVEIAKARNKPAYWGVLMLIPFINLISLVILAVGPEYKGVADKAYVKEPEQERVNVS